MSAAARPAAPDGAEGPAVHAPAPAPSLTDMTALEALTMLRDLATDPMTDLGLAVAATIVARGYAHHRAESLAARAENCARIAEDSPDFADAQRWRKRSQRLAAEATELRKFAGIES